MRKHIIGIFIARSNIFWPVFSFKNKKALIIPIIPKTKMTFDIMPCIFNAVVINSIATVKVIKNKVFFRRLIPFFTSLFLSASGLIKNITPEIINNHPINLTNIHTSFNERTIYGMIMNVNCMRELNPTPRYTEVYLGSNWVWGQIQPANLQN